MVDDIKPEVIKKTQEILGKFIKKPVLTEKLLTKPPFRFLHDICTAAMRETGFFEGILNSTDVKADSIKDKEGKIAFLQKVISAVEATNGNKLVIKPNKVVAGHEPVHTNEFLQALGKALEKQVKQNGNATRSTHQSKSKLSKSKTLKRTEKEELSQQKKGSITRQSKTDKSIERNDRGEGSTKVKLSPETNSSKPEKSEEKQKKQGKSEVTTSPDDKENVINKHEKKIEDGDEKTTKLKEKAKLKNSKTPSQDNSELQNDNKGNKIEDQSDQSNEKNAKSDLEQSEVKRPTSAKSRHRKSVSLAEAAEPVTMLESSLAKDIENFETTKSDVPLNKVASEVISRRPESSFLRHNKKTSITTTGTSNYQTKDTDPIEDSSPVSRPLTGIRPITGRPASARPAAPRIRDRGEVPVIEDVIKQSPGNMQIITDKKESDEPEDENIVTVEPENEIVADMLEGRMEQMDMIAEQNLSPGEHGLLVEQILETQKELDNSRLQIMDSKLSGKADIEWKSSRNRDSTDREIKKLRLCIQSLTRSANPLGKLLDFLQEDIDIMQKELDNWREMNSNLDVQIAQEKSFTEQSIEPLKVHLRELQQIIDQQLEQMAVVKGNILRNDQKIQKLLTDMK